MAARQHKDWAKDVWAARDQYRVENFLIGCAMTPVLVVVAFIVLMLL